MKGQENQGRDITGILSCESGELFMRFFKQYLSLLFQKYPEQFNRDVPNEFLINHLVGSFSEAVLWWINSDGMKHAPEEIAEYYMRVIN